MRRFYLLRHEDESGTSGVGIVADGIEFPNGVSVLCWRGVKSSIAIYNTAVELIDIHGHGGKTELVWYTGDVAQAPRLP